ncbi:hypothetical protein ACLD0W_06590 [Alloalcanivorax sp. C16-1]|uniref:hypothetical protein n=1 Tax=Alloalcanivorax sp. C16-1 TaxID=3390051 RepID=UPI0039708A59
MKKYHLLTGEGVEGPYTSTELAQMEVDATTYIKPDSEDAEWTTCGAVEEIGAVITERFSASVEKLGALGGDMSAAGAMHWGPAKADMCKNNGRRQFSAVLWDIPWGKSWEDACWAMPNTINGHYFARPNRCINNGQMWGEWDVPDASCGAAASANVVVFQKANEPLNLGHSGWGFKLSNGQWCYGATEIFGELVVQPGDYNGVYIQTGSKEQMFMSFRTGNTPHVSNWPYQFYKALIAGSPNENNGRAMAEKVKQAGYWLNGNNCMNHTIKILNAYAGTPIVPVSDAGTPQYWVPNFWFAQIKSNERSTSDPF